MTMNYGFDSTRFKIYGISISTEQLSWAILTILKPTAHTVKSGLCVWQLNGGTSIGTN